RSVQPPRSRSLPGLFFGRLPFVAHPCRNAVGTGKAGVGRFLRRASLQQSEAEGGADLAHRGRQQGVRPRADPWSWRAAAGEHGGVRSMRGIDPVGVVLFREPAMSAMTK